MSRKIYVLLDVTSGFTYADEDAPVPADELLCSIGSDGVID